MCSEATCDRSDDGTTCGRLRTVTSKILDRKKMTQSLVRGLIILVVAILPPVLLCAYALGTSAASIMLFGTLVGTLNTVTGGLRLGVSASLFLLLLTPIALVSGTVPLAGACLMAIVSFIAGVSAGWGLNRGIVMIPLGMIFLMALPQPVNGHQPDPGSEAYLLSILAGMAVCAFWSVGAVYMLIRNKQLPSPPHNTVGDTAQYAITISLLVSVATYYVLAFGRENHGVWLVLTLLVVLQTGPQSTLSKAWRRVLGTMAGALLGALVIAVTDNPVVIAILVVLALTGTLAFLLSGPYALYSTFLTLVIVLSAAPGDAVVRTGLERAFFTVLGAILAVGGMAVAEWLRRRPTVQHLTKPSAHSA